MLFNFARFFGFSQQPKFDNLLKKDNLTIECIFNEDDILQELKGTSSAKFADFLIQHPQEYLKMINYIIEDIPDQCTDKNRCVKYPFYGSEILGSDNEKLINFLFEKPNEEQQEDGKNQIHDNEETEQIEQNNNNVQEKEIIRASLLDNLLKLLENDSILITTAGYFTKVVNSIINRKGNYFWEHLKHYPDILSNLFKHAYLKHIVDIFEKLIILEDNFDKSIYYMNERSALLSRLVVFLKGKQHSQVIVENICELFVELYRKSINSFDNQNQEYKKMLAQFTIKTTPLFFMNLALSTQQSVVYQVLNFQFEFLNKFCLSDQTLNINLIQLYKPVIQLFEKAITQVDSFKIPFISADGTQVKPLGDAKLFIIQLIVSLIYKSEFYPHFTAELFSQIIDLVKLHPTNNQLHLLFERVIVAIFDTNDEFLHRLLFEDTNLLLFIVQHNNEKARQNKYGYQGVLTRLSNYLDSNKNKSQSFQIILELLQTISIDWDEYMKGLARVNKKEQEWILGINPRQKEQKFTEEIINQNVKEEIQQQNHLIQEINKPLNSDNNAVIQPKDVDNENVEIEEDIQLDSEEKQNENTQVEEKEQINNQDSINQKENERQIVEINQNDQQNNLVTAIENKQEEQENKELNVSEQQNQEKSNNIIDNPQDQEINDQVQLNDNLTQSEDPQKMQQQVSEETQEIIPEQTEIKEDEVEKEEIEEEIVQSQDDLEDYSFKNQEEQLKQNIEQENENKEEPKQIE